MIVFDIDHHHLLMRFLCVKIKIRIDVKWKVSTMLLLLIIDHDKLKVCAFIGEKKALDQKEHAWLPDVDCLLLFFLTTILTSVLVRLEWTIVWFPNDRNRDCQKETEGKGQVATNDDDDDHVVSRDIYIRDHRNVHIILFSPATILIFLLLSQ